MFLNNQKLNKLYLKIHSSLVYIRIVILNVELLIETKCMLPGLLLSNQTLNIPIFNWMSITTFKIV